MYRFRILYFSSFGSIKGGGQKSLLLLCKNINKNNYIPICITPDFGSFSEQLKKMNIKNYVIPMGRTKSFNFPRIFMTTLKIYHIIKKEKIDLLHTDGPRNTLYAGLAAKVAGIPLICHVRVVDKPRFDDRIMAAFTDEFIFVSKSAQKRFSWAKGKIASTIIYNGIDVEDFYEYQADNRFSQEDSLYEYKIGCIGRIEEAKGQKYLIQAVNKIADHFKNVRFYFVGEEDRAYLGKILKNSSSILNKIRFFGYQKNPYTVMKDLDVIVLPSLSEGFSRVILEAMAMKKPVIATNVGGNPEAIIDGVTGYLIPSRNPDAISEKVISLLSDNEKRLDMGEAGYQRVNSLFSLENNVKQIERVYDRLLSNN